MSERGVVALHVVQRGGGDMVSCRAALLVRSAGPASHGCLTQLVAHRLPAACAAGMARTVPQRCVNCRTAPPPVPDLHRMLLHVLPGSYCNCCVLGVHRVRRGQPRAKAAACSCPFLCRASAPLEQGWRMRTSGRWRPLCLHPLSKGGRSSEGQAGGWHPAGRRPLGLPAVQQSCFGLTLCSEPPLVSTVPGLR